jgi:hypothetical protein
MKTSKENAQNKMASAPISRSTAEQAELQQAEEEHWETLLSLLAQSPAAVLPAAAPRERGKSGEVPNTIASKPLLKPEPAAVSIKIKRGAAEQYPLPSNVTNARSAKRSAEPVAKPQVAKPAAEQPVQVESHEGAAIEAPPAAAPSHPAEPRHAVSHEKHTESWAERLAQRVLSAFDQTRTERASSLKPVNQAEIAYNTQGHVDYVTYTINAPARKSRRDPLT